MKLHVLLVALAGLSGCAQLPFLDRLNGSASGDPARPAVPGAAGEPAPLPVPAAAAVDAPAASPSDVLSGPATSAAALDTVTEAEKEEARAAADAAPAGGELGQATVSLGDPAEAGLWVKTALVDADTPGTVRTAGGEAVAVTLRPLDGAGGAQISLSALQALGLPLTGLHPVTLARAG